jgi:hypothetical protein
VKTTRSSARGALSRARGCSISSGPTPVMMVRAGRYPFRTTCLRPLLVRPVGGVREEGLHFALQGSLKHLPGSPADIAVQGATALVGNRLAQALTPRQLDRFLSGPSPGVLAI